MTNIPYLRGNQGANTVNTDRKPSPFIWASCPWDEVFLGAKDGLIFFDDFDHPYFTTPTTDGVWTPYHAFTSTGGTLVPSTPALFGTLELSSNDDDEGASFQTLAAPFKISLTNGRLWFEARVKVSTIADTTFDCFIGLMEAVTLTATVPITATGGTLADKNFVGWHRTAVDGDDWVAKYKTDGNAVVAAVDDAFVPVADTYCKLGMYYDGVATLTWFANGVSVGTYTVTSTAGNPFPNDIGLALTGAVLNAAGSSPGTFSLDWVRVCQLAFGE